MTIAAYLLGVASLNDRPAGLYNYRLWMGFSDRLIRAYLFNNSEPVHQYTI